MTRQCQRSQDAVHHAQIGWDTTSFGQKSDRQGRVQDEHPNQAAHDATGGVGLVEPNAVLVAGPERARPWHVVEVVFVIQTRVVGCATRGLTASPAPVLYHVPTLPRPCQLLGLFDRWTEASTGERFEARRPVLRKGQCQGRESTSQERLGED